MKYGTYDTYSHVAAQQFWLESSFKTGSTSAWYIDGFYNNIDFNAIDISGTAVKPAIDVPKSMIRY